MPSKPKNGPRQFDWETAYSRTFDDGTVVTVERASSSTFEGSRYTVLCHPGSASGETLAFLNTLSRTFYDTAVQLISSGQESAHGKSQTH